MKRKNHESYLRHYIDELNQDLTLWVFVDLLSFSNISILFSITDSSIKKTVANSMNIKVKGDELLSKFLHSLTIIRNLCAHGSRLYNRLFQQKPFLNKNERELLLKRDNDYDNDHLFGFILIMKRLLNVDEFEQMKFSIKYLCDKYPFVDMKYYGFSKDWFMLL